MKMKLIAEGEKGLMGKMGLVYEDNVSEMDYGKIEELTKIGSLSSPPPVSQMKEPPLINEIGRE